MDITWVAYYSIERAGDQYVSDVASVRYRLLIPAHALSKLGHRVEFLQIGANDHSEDIMSRVRGEVVIISKLVASDREMSEKLSMLTRRIVESVQASGRRAIADFCDDHFAHPLLGNYYRALVNDVALNVASTPEMAEILRRHTQRPICVVGDPYEGVKGCVKFRPPRREARNLIGRVIQNISGIAGKCTLKLLWFGHGSNLRSIVELFPGMRTLAADYTVELHLVTVSHPEVERICADSNENYGPAFTIRLSIWSTDVTWHALQNCDLVLIPIQSNDPSKLVKSPNRLVEALWAGRFVVANPIPSYEEFGDFVWLGDRLVNGVRWALAHPAEVRRKIAAGQEYIQKNYSPEAIARQWDSALKEALDVHASPAPKVQALRLNLGCGDKILPGYVNVDIAANRGGARPDVVCDLRNLASFSDSSVDEVLSVHVVEHFWRWEVLDILKEWVKVLKPGGTMILECPNLLSACQELLRDPEVASGAGGEGQRTMWVFYGDPGWRDPLMVHRWGYTPHSLAQVMSEAGLVNVRQEPAQFKLREPRDMRLVGQKPA
jgi:hypothetical protein